MKQHQVNIVRQDANGETIVTGIETLNAKDVKSATEKAATVHGVDSIRVYPLATITDGASILELARYTLASVERWERRNEHAVLEPYKRTIEDKEDFIQAAALAILEVLLENPDTPMFFVKRAAFQAITAEKKRRQRNSDREYMPGWSGCNITPRSARPTVPEMDALVRRAIADADFTDAQAAIFSRFFDGMSAADIADELNIKRATVYTHLKRAEYKLLQAMNAIDPEHTIFDAAGYSDSDIDGTLDSLAKRAK